MYDMYQRYIAKSDPFIVMVSTPTLLMVCSYIIFRRGQHLTNRTVDIILTVKTLKTEIFSYMGCLIDIINYTTSVSNFGFVIEKSLCYKLDSTIIDATDSMFNNEIISSN